MFELVEQQPSHLACPDVLHLSLGESEAAGPRPRWRRACVVAQVWSVCCAVLPPCFTPGPSAFDF